MTGRDDRGFALVNALVMVAAIAVIAASVMATASVSQRRGAFVAHTAQLEQYLEGTALMLPALAVATVPRSGPIAPVQDWARSYSFPVGRGEVAGRLVDLQGLFNLRWIEAGDEEWALFVFAGLCRNAGLDPSETQLLRDAVVRAGPLGQLHWPGDLVPLSGVDPRRLAGLLPLTTVLPPAVRLNLNTAAPEILVALLPEVPRSRIDALLALRARQALVSADEFRFRLAPDLDPASDPRLQALRPTIRSEWFRAEISSRMASGGGGAAETGASLSRHILLHWPETQGVPRRVGQFPADL